VSERCNTPARYYRAKITVGQQPVRCVDRDNRNRHRMRQKLPHCDMALIAGCYDDDGTARLSAIKRLSKLTMISHILPQDRETKIDKSCTGCDRHPDPICQFTDAGRRRVFIDE